MSLSTRDDQWYNEFIATGRKVWQRLRDPAVPRWQKAIPALALVYLISPIDLLPDVVPGITQIDDLAVLLIALRVFLSLGGESAAPDADANGGSVAATYRVRD